jgi:hypothetical protein
MTAHTDKRFTDTIAFPITSKEPARGGGRRRPPPTDILSVNWRDTSSVQNTAHAARCSAGL